MHVVEGRNARVEAKRMVKADQAGDQHGIVGWVMRAINSLGGGTWAVGARAKPRRMKVLETLAIGPKKQLLLVSCDGENYLVGPESVQTIVRMEARSRASVPSMVDAEQGERP